jgi:N-acetylglucosamine kinase-like BadF-type ATPase
MPVVGVDGGNTKTLAVVADESGHLLGLARGGPSDLYSAETPQAAVDEVYRVVDAALVAAGTTRSALAGAALSMAGADWEEDFALHREAAQAQLPGVPVAIVNDAIGPIRVLGPHGPAAALMCGTGAAIGARGADGQVWSLGFTPRSGSAHGLGREALSAVQESDMGCGPDTQLTARLLDALGLDEPRDIVREFSRRGGLRDVAALAPQVLAAAEDGDEVAVHIVELVGYRMGCWTRHAAERVGIHGPFRLLVGGGLLTLPGAERLTRAALAELSEADPVPMRAEPVFGAVLLALDQAGASVDEAALLAKHPALLR